MEAGHNGVVCGLAVAKHAGGEPRLVLGLVPILHRQITDKIVSDLVNGHGIVLLPAQVKKNYSSHNNKTRHGRAGDFGRKRLLQDCLNIIYKHIKMCV